MFIIIRDKSKPDMNGMTGILNTLKERQHSSLPSQGIRTGKSTCPCKNVRLMVFSAVMDADWNTPGYLFKLALNIITF